MITICPLCKIPLVMGQAIKPKDNMYYRSIVPFNETLKASEIKLIDCLKCPKCGYSDDGN